MLKTRPGVVTRLVNLSGACKMAFQIVQCEVRWTAQVGYSGNELPPIKYESVGDFETERDAEQALADAGFTRLSYGWRSYQGYGYGYVTRYLKELTEI